MIKILNNALISFVLVGSMAFTKMSDAREDQIFVKAEEVDTNYSLPHQVVKVEREELEAKLRKFSIEKRKEEMWLFVKYKNGESYAFEIGEKSEIDKVYIYPIIDFEAGEGVDLDFFDETKAEEISLYHFHPDVLKFENAPFSCGDMYIACSFAKYFHPVADLTLDGIKLDARVVDQHGVFTVDLDRKNMYKLTVANLGFYPSLVNVYVMSYDDKDVPDMPIEYFLETLRLETGLEIRYDLFESEDI